MLINFSKSFDQRWPTEHIVIQSLYWSITFCWILELTTKRQNWKTAINSWKQPNFKNSHNYILDWDIVFIFFVGFQNLPQNFAPSEVAKILESAKNSRKSSETKAFREMIDPMPIIYLHLTDIAEKWNLRHFCDIDKPIHLTLTITLLLGAASVDQLIMWSSWCSYHSWLIMA